MKKQLIKSLVLLLAIAGGSVYVWHASQRAKPPIATQQPENVTTKEPSQSEPKNIVITDEEVRASRESMMSTSKSGLIMSEEDTRKMLEQTKKLTLTPPGMATSSKFGAILSPEEAKKITEKIAPFQPAPVLPNEQK